MEKKQVRIGNKNAEKYIKRSAYLHQRHFEEDMVKWQRCAFESGVSFTQWVRASLNKELNSGSN